MKNAIILHGTNGDHNENWFPWLQKQLEEKGYKVWTPDLPEADKPNIKRYNKFLLEESDWSFDKDSIIIGHSSGAVAILGLLQALPDGVKVDTCYLVGAFKDDLGWDALTGLFEEPFDFDLIKSRASHFVFIHSDNDPYCPLDHAEYLAEQLGGQLIVKKGQKHFSVGTFGEEYREFPFLLRVIQSNYFANKAEKILKLCRPGDWEHARRVAYWVEELADDRPDWERLMKTAFVHDMGWYLVSPQEKLTKAELKKLEPRANENSDLTIREFLVDHGESSREINEILRLVKAADKHKSQIDDEAIIVDADNLSKLNMDHVSEKYQKSDWLRMVELWESEFPKRIQTKKGRGLYPKLLKELRSKVEGQL